MKFKGLKNNGHFLAISSFTIWGLFPLYWHLLAQFNALELTAYRIVFGFLSSFLILSFGSNIKESLKNILHPKVFGFHLGTTFFIGLNWYLFVYAVNTNQVMQASFGYFSGPLLTMFLGIFFLKEKVNKLKLFAILIAVIGVSIRALSLDGAPWLSFSLATTFSLYGLMKKFTPAQNSTQGLFYETLILLIPCVLYLFYVESNGSGHLFEVTSFVQFILTLSGIVTLAPLILFASAVKKVPLNSIGFMQYISPSLQLICALFIFNEKMHSQQLWGFIFIWIACFLQILSLNKKTQPVRSYAR